MKTQYRTAFWADKNREKLVSELKYFGIILKPNQFKAVEFFDDDEHFEALKNLFEKYKMSLDKLSFYTDAERLASKYLGMQPSWHHGYPQPEDDYEELCYNLTLYCPECGIGAKQIKPLRLTGEPKWGRRQMLQLNWIFDEYFATPEIYNRVFKPAGIGFWDVIHNRKNTVLQSVVQLNLPTAESNLLMEGYPFEICKSCYKKKYLPITTGGYPMLKKETYLPVFKSQEFFGSGASADKRVFVNNSLYIELSKSKVKGVSFVPVFEK